MRIGRELRSQRNAVPELAGMDVDHSLSDLVPGTVAGDLGEHPGRLHPKPFLASMTGKVTNWLIHSLAPEAPV